MKIKSKNLIRLGIVTLSLPYMLFVVFWCKVYIGVPLFLLSIYILDVVIKKKLEVDDREYMIKVPYLILSFVFIMIIMILGGHGEWWSQHHADWPVRYAAYRDLIDFEWPVIYPDNSFLCYYFGYFLPPAAISKLITVFISDVKVSHMVTVQAELLWGTYVVFLVYLLILDFIHKRSKGFKKYIDIKEILIVLMIFLFFSGLDVVGSFLPRNCGNGVFNWEDNIDCWSYKPFTCIVSNLWDAFNQAIMFHLACILIFMQEDMTMVLYIAGVSFISMIFPLLGMAIVCIPLLIKRIRHITELISIENIVGVIALVITLLFYMGQSGMMDSVSEKTSPIRICVEVFYIYKDIILFLVLEFYIYFILLYKKNRKDMIYMVSGLTVWIFVLIEYVNGPWEMTMRCSMPMIYYMLILSAKEMIDFYHDKKIEVSRVLLIIVLILGVGSPLCDIYRGINLEMKNYWKPEIHDEVRTFSDKKGVGTISQYKGDIYKSSLFHRTVGR